MTMTPARVLIVDDEESVRFVLLRTLRSEGYGLDTAVDGTDARQKLQQQPYDLIILDLHMEPTSGMELFNWAHQYDPDLAVIILTAHGSLESSLEALRLQAADYLLKPADPDVLRARVRQVLQQRQEKLAQRDLYAQTDALRQLLNNLPQAPLAPPQKPKPDTSHQLVSGQLQLDSQRQTAHWNETQLDLTTAEFNILYQLVCHAPTPQSPTKLVQEALGYESETYEAREIIKWHIHKLRRKIEPDPSHPQFIKTVRYKGYLWIG